MIVRSRCREILQALSAQFQRRLGSYSSISCYRAAHLPRYRTVLRGTGFQLRPSDFSHPTRNTRSKTLVPPMAPVSAAICGNSCRVTDRGINELIGGTRESSPAPGSLPRERKINPSAGGSNSLLLLAWLFIRTNLVTTVFTTRTFFKTPHIQAALKGTFLSLSL